MAVGHARPHGCTFPSGGASERFMKKSPKPATTRKPPEPSTSHADIDEWLRRVMPDLQPIVAHLDREIRDALPDLQYAVKWRKAFYGVPELGWVIELVSYDVSANIVFHGGADFDDPPPLGETGRSRYVKVRSLAEARAPEIRAWIEEAGRVPGWR